MRESGAMVTESGGEMSRGSSGIPPVGDDMTIDEEEDDVDHQQQQTTGDSSSNEFRVVAARVVEDVITKASEEVAHREETSGKVTSSPTKAFSPPTIQIDLVGSQTPSPTEEDEPAQKESGEDSNRKSTRQQQHDDDQENKASRDGSTEGGTATNKGPEESSPSGSTPPTREASAGSKASDDPDISELREFAFSYVKDVIAKAAKAAEEKMMANAAQTVTTFEAEEVATTVLDKTASPWYLRLREAFIRFFRSACPCRARQRDS